MNGSMNGGETHAGCENLHYRIEEVMRIPVPRTVTVEGSGRIILLGYESPTDAQMAAEAGDKIDSLCAHPGVSDVRLAEATPELAANRGLDWTPDLVVVVVCDSPTY